MCVMSTTRLLSKNNIRERIDFAKPILFNTEMVKAILRGRKTQTRRVIKGIGSGFKLVPSSPFYAFEKDGMLIKKHPPYFPGDILYVRETFAPLYPDETSTEVCGYLYKADEADTVEDYDRKHPDGKNWTWEGIWKPSIHMPKEAARIFLRGKDVHPEHLSNMSADDAIREGFAYIGKDKWDARDAFGEFWDSTIKGQDRARYTWKCDPWVWVINFERIEVKENSDV